MKNNNRKNDKDEVFIGVLCFIGMLLLCALFRSCGGPNQGLDENGDPCESKIYRM